MALTEQGAQKKAARRRVNSVQPGGGGNKACREAAFEVLGASFAWIFQITLLPHNLPLNRPKRQIVVRFVPSIYNRSHGIG
jgi:hypothetical protein